MTTTFGGGTTRSGRAIRGGGTTRSDGATRSGRTTRITVQSGKGLASGGW